MRHSHIFSAFATVTSGPVSSPCFGMRGLPLRFGSGIVVAVTFQKVDHTPDAKAGSKCYYEGLQYSNCAVKKCHIVLQKVYFMEGTLFRIHGLLFLAGASLLAGCVYLKCLKLFFRLQFEFGGKKTLYVEGVLFIKIRQIFIVGMLGNVVFIRQKWPYTTEL